MTDSDFTIGFKQGQEHGIQIMQEKIEDIKADIKEQRDFAIDCNGESDLGIALKIIDNHIGEVRE